MTESAIWVPADLDQDVASAARIYDYLLGGGHNFAVDRRVAEQFAAALPGAREIARLHRAFLRRAVLAMVDAGVRQFLDIGSGMPTVGNVHEIAQRANPAVNVVYVDIDQVAVEHSKLLLEANDRATAILADLRNPDRILDHCETRRLLDFDEPIGLLMVGVLHFVPDEAGPHGLVARYLQPLASGSYLALSHFTADHRPARMAAMVEVMRQSKDPIHPRSRERFSAFFAGLELVEPGVVSTALWRPDNQSDLAERPERDQILVGVGRKP